MEALNDLVKAGKVRAICASAMYGYQFYNMQIVARVQEVAEKHGTSMAQVAIAWLWAKGVTAPIIGGTKVRNYDDAVKAFDLKLTPEEISYPEEPYLPHKIIGAIDHNPPQGVMLLDKK